MKVANVLGSIYAARSAVHALGTGTSPSLANIGIPAAVTAAKEIAWNSYSQASLAEGFNLVADNIPQAAGQV